MFTHTRNASTIALIGLTGLVGLTVACGDDSASGPGVAAIDEADGADDIGDVSEDAGDGDDGDDGEVDFNDALLEYTQCMRDEGIDMSQPVFVDGDSVAVVAADGQDGDVEITSDDIDAIIDDEGYEKALETCGPLMEGAFESFEVDPETQAEMQDRMLDWARCMRERGHDVPDPQVHDDGTVVVESDVVGAEPADGDDGFGADSSACHSETGADVLVGGVDSDGHDVSGARPGADDEPGAGAEMPAEGEG